MDIAPEFHDFCKGLHQDIMDFHGRDAMNWIEPALGLVRRGGQPALRSYLSELLSGKYDWKALQDIWYSTYADVFFYDERSLRNFLRMTINFMDGKTDLTEGCIPPPAPGRGKS